MSTNITTSPETRGRRDNSVPCPEARDRAKHVDDPTVAIRERFPGGALLCKWPELEER